VSNRTDVWTLLLQRLGTWVTRTEIEFVGGAEGMRRLRELRDTVYLQGYSLTQRQSAADGRTLEYRLTKIEPTLRSVDAGPVVIWRCLVCGGRPAEGTQPSIDPRWRIGRCSPCRNKDATFERTPA
jgi:hypothetical protein